MDKIKMSGYSHGGASLTSKILKSWTPQKLSSKTDIDVNLESLRNRASDLAINTPIGSAAINTLVSYVIGTGLKAYPRPKNKIIGMRTKESREWTRRTIEEFNLWASTVDCDANRRNDFYEMQRIAYQAQLVDGDSFAVFKRRKPTINNPYTLRLQIVEGNRVSNPLDGSTISVNPYNVEGRAANGNKIISGVEINKEGEIEAYYVSNRVPNDILGRDELTEWVRVEAFGKLSGLPNILQMSRDSRADQFRGVPLLAPVIETLKQTSRYTNAELSSAIIKSLFALFFVQPEKDNSIEDILPTGENEKEENEGVVDVTEYSLGSGTLNALPKGVDVKAIDGGKSQSAFGTFIEELTMQVGAALNIPQEVLTKSFKASYSAARAALLQAGVEFKQSRESFIRDFCQPVYENFMLEAVASGRIKAPGYFEDVLKRAAYNNCEWYSTSVVGQLDPVKEIEGAQMRIALGLSTYEKEAAEICGTNFDENIERLVEEQEMMKMILGGEKNK